MHLQAPGNTLKAYVLLVQQLEDDTLPSVTLPTSCIHSSGLKCLDHDFLCNLIVRADKTAVNWAHLFTTLKRWSQVKGCLISTFYAFSECTHTLDSGLIFLKPLVYKRRNGRPYDSLIGSPWMLAHQSINVSQAFQTWKIFIAWSLPTSGAPAPNSAFSTFWARL